MKFLTSPLYKVLHFKVEFLMNGTKPYNYELFSNEDINCQRDLQWRRNG